MSIAISKVIGQFSFWELLMKLSFAIENGFILF
jgi:hypothetical protein